MAEPADELPKADDLFNRLYAELRAIAARQLGRLPPGQSLQPTEVVHEAYARLAGRAGWASDKHFLNAAAQAMRQLLVDRARRRLAARRGGGQLPVELDERLVVDQPDEHILAVHEALTRLTDVDPRAAKLVELVFFLGLSQDEAADAAGVSERTGRRDLLFAKAWLARELERS